MGTQEDEGQDSLLPQGARLGTLPLQIRLQIFGFSFGDAEVRSAVSKLTE